LEELTAICQEAEAAGTYVAAHAYTPPAIKRALSAGVRSIEHGNWYAVVSCICVVTKLSHHLSDRVENPYVG
jgi:hypothetical protein